MQISAYHILSSDNGKEFSNASMAYIADQLGFTKVYISPYSPFFFMYVWDTYLPNLNNVLQPKICYTGNDECKIYTWMQ